MGYARCSQLMSNVRPHEDARSNTATPESDARFLGIRLCRCRRHCVPRGICLSCKANCGRSLVRSTPALYLSAVEGRQTKARSSRLPGVSGAIAPASAEQHGRRRANTSSLQKMRDPVVCRVHILFLAAGIKHVRRMRREKKGQARNPRLVACARRHPAQNSASGRPCQLRSA